MTTLKLITFQLLFLLLINLSPSGEALSETAVLRYPASNMEPLIEVGQEIGIDKAYYNSRKPERGDIVAFRLPDDPRTKRDERKSFYIMRVVAIAGDTIQVKGTEVIINDKVVSEPHVQWKFEGRTNFPKTTVPDAAVFVMGDNRDLSRDSRSYPSVFVPLNDLIGRVLID